jgi:hypothetical protein
LTRRQAGFDEMSRRFAQAQSSSWPIAEQAGDRTPAGRQRLPGLALSGSSG